MMKQRKRLPRPWSSEIQVWRLPQRLPYRADSVVEGIKNTRELRFLQWIILRINASRWKSGHRRLHRRWHQERRQS